MKDRNDIELSKGDVINIHQTVNGQHLFVIMDLEPLDIRYAHDLNRKYEYDKLELIAPNKFNGETEFSIQTNLYSYMSQI